MRSTATGDGTKPLFCPWPTSSQANLSDRQAADAVRARIDWKYALSLELTDPGFDYSVLSEFWDRLLDGDMEQELLDTMLTVFQEHGLLKNRTAAAINITRIDDWLTETPLAKTRTSRFKALQKMAA